jgi:hypothetical protein
MWPQRRLTELLQIVHPLILAPMAGLGTVELAASVRRWRSRLDRFARSSIPKLPQKRFMI